jgi:hypothetical protein
MSLFSAKPRAFAAAALILAAAVHAPSTAAADAVVRVNASTFNQLMSALNPIPFSGRYAFRTTVDLGIFGRHTITWCDSGYAGRVDGLVIDITSSRIRAQGDVSFSWCGLNFGAPGKELTATGNVVYRSSDQTLRLNFSSVTVRPTFNLLGNIITLPLPVNLSGMLNVPALPMRPVGIAFQTSAGTHVLGMRPTNVDVDLGAGFVTVSSDFVVF